MAKGKNRRADSLATLALAMTEDVPRISKVELITKPSVNTIIDVGVVGISVTTVSTAKPCWMNPIVDFLAEDRIPDNEKEASKVRRLSFKKKIFYFISISHFTAMPMAPFAIKNVTVLPCTTSLTFGHMGPFSVSHVCIQRLDLFLVQSPVN